MDHHLPSSPLDSLAHCSVAWAFEGGNCDGNHLPMSVGWISKNFRCFPIQRFIDPNKNEVAKCEVPWKQVKRLQENHRINFRKIIKITFCRSKRTFFWFVRSLFCCLKVVQILLQAAKTSVAGRGHGVRRTSCENASIIPSITSLMDCNSYGFNKLPCFYTHSFGRGKRCFWVLASSWWLILANVVRCLNTKNNLKIRIKTNQSVRWGLLELCFSGLTISSKPVMDWWWSYHQFNYPVLIPKLTSKKGHML